MTTTTFETEPHPNWIARDIELGERCKIGRHVVIEEGVCLGDGVRIGDGVFIGHGSRIGDETTIGNRATIREHTWIGKNVRIESGVCLGCDGFGFAQKADGTQFKIPQAGIVEIGDGCVIEANATIDRATLGKTILRDRVRVGPLVMVGHNVVIAEDCSLESQSGVSGSAKISAKTSIGPQAGLVGHLKVGEGCRIEAYTGVTKSLAAGAHHKGVYPAMAPAKFEKQQELIGALPELVERIEELENKTAATAASF